MLRALSRGDRPVYFAETKTKVLLVLPTSDFYLLPLSRITIVLCARPIETLLAKMASLK